MSKWDYAQEREAAAKLQLHVERHEHEVGIEAVGDISYATAVHARTLITESFDEVEVSKVTLSLAKVGFMDSAGFKVVADAYRHAVSLEKDFELHNPSPALQKIFSVTGLSKYIPIILERTDSSR